MTELEQYIHEYLRHITLFHNALKTIYNLQIEPTFNEARTLFPKMGEFTFGGKNFEYRYHGNGCTLIVDSIIVDYDLNIFDTSQVEITNWKFYRFIETYAGGQSKISLNDLNALFVELSSKGKLTRKYPDGFVFHISLYEN